MRNEATWPYESFSAFLTGLRDRAGIRDDSALSRRAGINPSLISNWRSGKQQPSPTSLNKVADALHVDRLDMWVAAGLATRAELDEVDRAAWATLLRELVASAAVQSPTRSGPISRRASLVEGWLMQERPVRVADVIAVCRDCGYPPARALARVGVLTEAEVTPTAAAGTLPFPLRQIGAVLASDRVPPEVKESLRRAVIAAFDLWQEMLMIPKPPAEPTGRVPLPRKRSGR